MAAVKSVLAMYAHVTRIGDKSIGLMMEDGDILVYEREEVEAQLAMYCTLYPDKHGIVTSLDELKNLVADSGPEVEDCAYFVLVEVLLQAGAIECGETFRRQLNYSHN
jgi:hypothetical protein